MPRFPALLPKPVVGMLTLAAVTLLAATAPAVTPAAQAAYESDYASRATVTFGENARASMPVTLELPAPASGGAITAVTASRDEVVPQRPTGGSNTTLVRTSLDASGCTADATCTVHGVLPTARMVNGTPTVTFVVSNAEGTVSTFGRTPSVQNPKPTVAFHSPQPNDALWEKATLTADAAASPIEGAAPLKGVRFYTRGDLAVDASYLFDDTAPYSVTLEATDIAPVLGSQYLVVVAEDVDGNLSQMPVASQETTARRRVTVGPPPLRRWASPRVGGRILGSMRTGVSLEFHAALPDTAPTYPGHPIDPYISGYDVAVDGVPVGTSSWTSATSWNGYQAKRKMRAIDGWWPLGGAQGLTPGRHTVTVQVRTNYGAVSTLTSGILVADGVIWGPVRSGGQVVRDGHWVTAGTEHRFTVPVATRVAGTRLGGVSASSAGRDLFPAGWPCSAEPVTCPESTRVRTVGWFAPRTAGERVVTFKAYADGDRADTLTRTIRIHPAARLLLEASTRLVSPGRDVELTARLTRRDTGTPEAGRTVRLQWRKAGSRRWDTVRSGVTGRDGAVRFRARPTADGYYRLRSAQVLGEIGPGSSGGKWVGLRR